MDRFIYDDVLERIEQEEGQLSLSDNIIEESYRMVSYLQVLLNELKIYVLKHGFPDERVEINFFKKIKPMVVGKLVYYNKIYRIEINCPIDKGEIYINYFSKQFQNLKREYVEHMINSDFYKYYRSGRTDRDDKYFTRGNINYHDGLNSVVFEIDPEFSTFFDYKVSKIISNELVYNYLLSKITPDESLELNIQKSETAKDISWTDSKNALIELIYALHASGCITNGKLGIRKMSLVFQMLFDISLTDIHNSFYRMKTRSGSRTIFLDQLTSNLNDYMDKDESN